MSFVMAHTEDAQTRRMHLVLALFLTGAIALLGWQWWAPFDGGVDENGYLMAGRTLAEHGRLALVPGRSPGDECSTFVGDMWVGTDMGTPQERYYGKYPPGVPLLVAICWKIGGLETGRILAYLLNPVGYCVALLGVFALARTWTSSSAAIVAMLLVAFSAPVIRLFNVPGSHGISAGLLAWGATLLVWWLEEGRWWQAAGAGILCGYAAIVRSGEGILVLPLILATALHLRDRRRLIQGIAMLILWASPVIIAALLQHAATGSFSGYSITGEDSAFALAYLQANMHNILQGLTSAGMGLVIPLGLLGLMLLLRERPKTAAVMLIWVLSNVLVYAAYYWSPTSDVVVRGRFFLPSYAPLAAGAMFLIAALSQRFAPKLRWLPVTASLLIAAGSIAYVINETLRWARVDVIAKLNLEERLRWVQERVPPDSVLLCDEIDMLDHLQFASNLTLHEHRPFNEAALRYVIDTDRLNALDPRRRKYLREHFLALGQTGMTQLRDQMVSSYIKAGRHVFVFEGPRGAFGDWSSLARYGFKARRIADYTASEIYPFPNVAMNGVLEEIVGSPN